MFETGHAVSMTTADGAELLIHVGIDTVQLEGKHYKACCKAGQQVKKGDVLIEFDPAAIKAEGSDRGAGPVVRCTHERPISTMRGRRCCRRMRSNSVSE